MARRVVLVCGPPGAGKSTYARTLGLEVYDSDDPVWCSDSQFRDAVSLLSGDPDAQAVVIRAGSTRAARAKAAAMCRATEVVVLDVDEQVCVDRVKDRGRPGFHREIAGVQSWWERYEQDLGAAVGRTSRDW